MYKEFVYCLSHDSQLHIDRDASTVYWRSSSGDSVDLLSGTICTTKVVSDCYIMNLVQGWLVLI